MNKDGCGLGLTICKIMVEALGGILKVQSKVGEGSKFTLVLPFANTRESFLRIPKDSNDS